MRKIPTAFILAIVLLSGKHLLAEGNWPQWRGPNGTGHSPEKTAPVKWDAKSVKWKLDLPGQGQSSPIIWDDNIFLTSALDRGTKRVVFCVSRSKKKIVWQHVAWTGQREQTPRMNGYASDNCTTDGERVYAFFGKGGLHCYSVDGKPLWKRDLGEFPGKWGTGASPILVGDLLIQNCDERGKGLIRAFDKKTGEPKWATNRPAPQRGGWSTPILIDTGKRKEIVLNGEKAVCAYDPESGKELWSCKSVRGRGEPTVTPGKGLIFNINGQPGDISAMRPGGSGDITSTKNLVWRGRRTSGRDQPSPILIGDYLLVVSMKGIATCYNSADGKVLDTVRLNASGSFVSTPIAVGNKAYFISESGQTVVIEPGAKMKIVSTNDLSAPKAEIFRASLTPSKGQMFIRSDRALYCVE